MLRSMCWVLSIVAVRVCLIEIACTLIAFSWVFSTLLPKKNHKVTIDKGIDQVLPGSAKSGILYDFVNAVKADLKVVATVCHTWLANEPNSMDSCTTRS